VGLKKRLKKGISFSKRVIEAYREDGLLHYASSLSFHLTISLIPLLFISFSIFSHLPRFKGLYLRVKEFLLGILVPSEYSGIESYIDNFISNSTHLGYLGLIFTIYTSIMFILDYELIVSKIFKTRPKGFFISIVIYFFIITTLPIGLGVSFYIFYYINHVVDIENVIDSLNLYLFAPFFATWMIIVLLFWISTATKLKTKVLFLTSFLTTLVWYVSKWAFVLYVMSNEIYLSIYGPFSLILFFLLWIYFSWIIYLSGLKATYELNKR
jgi:membrane protein